MTDSDSYQFTGSGPHRPERGLKLFSPSGSRDRDASIGHHDVNWDVYCAAYRQGADVLVDHFLQRQNNYSVEYESQAFAIIFLYRHYLELRLKELFIAYGHLQGESIDIGGHRLINLWRKVHERASKDSEEDAPEVEEDMSVLEEIISQFDAIDPVSEVFRYPVLKDCKTVTLPEIQVDMERLRDVMQWVSYLMEGWSVGVYDHISMKHWESGA